MSDSGAGRVFNIDDGQTMVVDKSSRDGSKRVLVFGGPAGGDSDAASATSATSTTSTATMSNMDPRIQYVGSNPQAFNPTIHNMDPRIQYYGSNPQNIYQAQGFVNPAHYQFRHRPQVPVTDFFREWKKPVRAPVSVQQAGNADTFNLVGSGKVVFHDD